jgi:hypothetical protein
MRNDIYCLFTASDFESSAYSRVSVDKGLRKQDLAGASPVRRAGRGDRDAGKAAMAE